MAMPLRLTDVDQRLGWRSPVLMSALNGHLRDGDDDAYDLVVDAAEGRHDVTTIVDVLRRWGRGS